jgi:hypothetical protein
MKQSHSGTKEMSNEKLRSLRCVAVSLFAWFYLREYLRREETPLAIQCSQVMEKLYSDEKTRARARVSDYDGVDHDRLLQITTDVVVGCAFFFDGPSVVATKNVADHSRILARALNLSMTEESREWWLSVDKRHPVYLTCMSYWMMKIILSSYGPNLLRGQSTGYKQWYYPGDYQTLWSIQRSSKTMDGSWFNATKKVLAEILKTEEDNMHVKTVPGSLIDEIKLRMRHEEAARESLRESNWGQGNVV